MMLLFKSLWSRVVTKVYEHITPRTWVEDNILHIPYYHRGNYYVHRTPVSAMLYMDTHENIGSYNGKIVGSCDTDNLAVPNTFYLLSETERLRENKNKGHEMV